MERSAIQVPHKEKDRREAAAVETFSSCRTPATGKALPKIVAKQPSHHCKRGDAYFEDQGGFRPAGSADDTMFLARRLRELTRKKGAPLYACFIDLTKEYHFLSTARSCEPSPNASACPAGCW